MQEERLIQLNDSYSFLFTRQNTVVNKCVGGAVVNVIITSQPRHK